MPDGKQPRGVAVVVFRNFACEFACPASVYVCHKVWRTRRVMRGSVCGMLALIAMVALPVLGQTPAAQTSPAAISKPFPIARLPYMAEFKILLVRALPNGTAVTHESTVITVRETQGRHMTATTAIPTSADQTATTAKRLRCRCCAGRPRPARHAGAEREVRFNRPYGR